MSGNVSVPRELAWLINKPVQEIDTPALVIDLDAMRRNVARMAEFAKKHGIAWRPHAKTHKSAALARMLVKAGAVGACVQKVAEAEILAAGGVADIYISNQVVALSKLARVASLAQMLSERTGSPGRLAIAVDSTEGIIRLAQAMNDARQIAGKACVIDVYVEIDVGQGRCGVQPDAAAVTLVLELRKHAALRFAGLQAYHGAAQHLRSLSDRREAIAQAAAAVNLTRQLIEAQGIAVERVTGGGTGCMAQETASGVYSELQVGSFLFMDADYAKNERDPAQPLFEPALYLKTQIMSTSNLYSVCDAGHKSHAIDSGLPQVASLDSPNSAELVYANGGDEHGIIRLADASMGHGGSAHSALPGLGQTMWLIPGHCDPTVNLHDWMIGVSGGLRNGVVQRLYRVDGRGAYT